MCRHRGDGTDEKCGAGSRCRFRPAVGDDRRRLHRAPVPGPQLRRCRLYDALPDQSGDARHVARRQSETAGRPERLFERTGRRYAPQGAVGHHHGLFVARRPRAAQREAGGAARPGFQGLRRQQVRPVEEVYGPGQLRGRGLEDVPHAGGPVADTRPHGRAAGHRRGADPRAEGAGAREAACGMELHEGQHPAAAAACRGDDRLCRRQHRRAAHAEAEAGSRSCSGPGSRVV